MAQEAQRARASRVPGAAEHGEASDDNARRWLILGVVCLGQLMVVLDATVVNIALPTAQRDLAFSNADRQWVVTAYSLAFGGLLLLGGRLADLIGRKRMLIIGMVGFAAASALGGAAVSFPMLLAGRAIQGAFGAMLAPAALSTLTVTFTNPAERGRAFGIFGAIAGAGGAIGLLLGGVLTEYLSWRWCLYVNVVFSVIAVAAAVRLLSRDRPDPDVHLDMPGTVLVVAGLIGIVYGLSEAETKGWGAPLTIGLLVGGAVLLALFVLTEQRVAHPLLPLRIVLDRFRGGSYLAIGLSAIGLFGVFLFLTYYLEEVLRYSPVVTGLAFLPLIVALIASSTTSSGLLMPRVGPRILIPTGLLLAAGGLVILAVAAEPDHELPGLDPARARRHRPGPRPGVRLRAEHGDLRRRAGRRGGRVRPRQHLPAGRRLDWHRAAQHHRRQRAGQLPGDARPQPGGPGWSGGAQLRGRVLGIRRDLRRRCRGVRAGAEVRRCSPRTRPSRPLPLSPERRPPRAGNIKDVSA